VEDLTLIISGVAPLVVHSDRGVNPADPLKREIAKYTGKRKKTDEDHETISRLEFEMGLYWSDDFGPVMPVANVKKCLYEAAKKSKEGPKVKEGLLEMESIVPILYDGPRTIQGLYAEKDKYVYEVSVGVMGKRTMRTRPRFPEWMLEVPFIIDTERLDATDFLRFAETAGRYVGLCERRPMFGRFDVIVQTEGGSNGNGTVHANRIATAVA
jgi:hypothetical protein